MIAPDFRPTFRHNHHAHMSSTSSVGAAPPGLFCAGIAGQRGLRVLLLDHATRWPRRSASRAAGAATSPTIDASADALHLREPGLLPLGAVALHAADFIALVRAPRHRLSREAQGPAVLRRLRPKIIDAAAARDATPAACSAGNRAGACAAATRGCGYELDTDRERRSARWWSPPAACRSRRSAPPTSATAWPGSSACAWSRRARPGAADLRRRGWAPYAAWPGCRCRWRIETGAARPLRVRRGPAVHAPRARRARRCCRSPATGATGTPIRLDLAPGVDLPTALREAKAALAARWWPTNWRALRAQRLADAWVQRRGPTGNARGRGARPRRWRGWPSGCSAGSWCRRAPRATARPRSRWAASTRAT